MRRIVVLTASLFVLATAPAMATVTVGGAGEPLFTKGTSDTFFFRATNVGSPTYYVCFVLRENDVAYYGYTGSGIPAPGSANGCTNNISSANGTSLWVGGSQLVDGAKESACADEYYDTGGIIAPHGSACSVTYMDNHAPAISASVDGTATYTNDPHLTFHVDYSDSQSPPWPSTFICIQTAGASCNGVTFNYDPNCSHPNVYASRSNSFDCTGDASSAADGPVTFCAMESDSAFPDTPGSENQFAVTSDKANLSPAACGSVYLDRTPPQVAVQASATAVHVGDLVTFGGSATDAGSGPSNAYAWTFGDNTAAGAGQQVSHTFTAPGTYDVVVTSADGAGNQGTAHQVVTVTAAPSPQGTATTSGATGSGSVIAPPTASQIVQAAGGGGTQKAGLAGLSVLAPRSVRLKRRNSSLSLALTASSPGKVTIALVRGGRILARGRLTIKSAGTVGYRLKLSKRVKPGKYRLQVTFVPTGAKARTKSLKLTIKKAAVSKKKHASAGRSAVRAAGVSLAPAAEAIPTA